MFNLHSRIRGCLLGGAVGDALGAPIEFSRLSEIRAAHGPSGPSELDPGLITDDTQMTLFTAEGLIRAFNRGRARGIGNPAAVILHAYWRWLHTQGERPSGDPVDDADGTSWLTEIPELNLRRAPGTTCLTALRSGRFATPDEPINSSKGCGGVMRVAPVAFMPDDEGPSPFDLGCESAALTHGHPTGWLASGALALMLHRIASGDSVRRAALAALSELEARPDSAETRRALGMALETADLGPGSAERIEKLGAGWIAEEALAIGTYCALAGGDFEGAVRLAVTHTGDSDSTGSITGQILGTLGGDGVIPGRWLDALELRDVISTVADDLFHAFHDPSSCGRDGVYDWERYPGC